MSCPWLAVLPGCPAPPSPLHPRPPRRPALIDILTTGLLTRPEKPGPRLSTDLVINTWTVFIGIKQDEHMTSLLINNQTGSSSPPTPNRP